MKKIVKLNLKPDKDFMNVGVQLGTLSTLITMATDGLSKKQTSKPISHRLIGYVAGFGFSVLTGYILGVVDNSGVETVYEPEDDEVRDLIGMSVLDRYTGTYSGGKWTFWPDDGNVPVQISEDDVTCGRAWTILKQWRDKGETNFGVGDSESEAKADYLTHKHSSEKKYGKQIQITDLTSELEKTIKAKYGDEELPEAELPVGEFSGGEPIPSVGKASDEDWD